VSGADAFAIPEGYSLVDEANEAQIKAGDLLYHPEAFEFVPAEKHEIGDYVYGFHAVVRRTPQ
jgi:hypothetical protein